MRIIGGSAKGRKVGMRKSFSGTQDAGLRPTAAKVRKALFDIIGDRIAGCRFLDLYTGTGAVGIEALSRGAAEVVFVDVLQARIAAIRDMTERFGFSSQCSLVKDDALRFIRRCETPFDIIFVDPPYESGEIDRILPVIADSEALADDDLVIVEHSSRRSLAPEIGSLRLKKAYRYGDTALTVYQNQPA